MGMRSNYLQPMSSGYGANPGINSSNKNIFNNPQLYGGVGNIISGLFGNSSAPYEDASKELDKYIPQAENYQKPFYNAGTESIPKFQNWLSQMANPADFVNNLMSKYSESPGAQYNQQQLRRSLNNFGSASGLNNSSALNQQFAQDSSRISNEDINNWFNKVLGINNQYGAGQQSLINTGQGSANTLTQLLSQLANSKAQLAYGGDQADQGDFGQTIGGLAQLASLFL